MAFGINFFNRKEAPKKTSDSSVTEKAKALAGDATKLSAAAMALVGALDSSDMFSAGKMDKDRTPANKIEMSSDQLTPKAEKTVISWEDMQKINHEIDSLEVVKTGLEKQEDNFELKILNNKSELNKIISRMPTGKEYAGIYNDVEKSIREASKNYDLNTMDGLKKFSTDMLTQKNGKAGAVNPEFVKNTNPALATKLAAFSVDFNEKTKFGWDDLNVRDDKTVNEHNLIANVINDIIAEKKVDYEEGQIAMRDLKLKSSEVQEKNANEDPNYAQK